MAARLASLGLTEATGDGVEGARAGSVSKPRREVSKTGPRADVRTDHTSPSPKVHATGMRVSNHHFHDSRYHAPQFLIGRAAAKEMSVSHSLVWKRPVAQTAPDDGEFRRKKLKLNDLPVSSAKRTAIDGLLLTFKKSGEFDKFRKGIFSQFESSVR